jgi:hypothetical protein
MFEVYVDKGFEPRKWLRYTFLASVTLHVAGGIALVALSMWEIEKLEPKFVPVTFESAALPPPPHRRPLLLRPPSGRRRSRRR